MAGGHMKYRTLSRDSAHRRALLRNLVTSLVKLESIQTTYAKAKEAQTMADKLITLAKRNNETARRAAQGILFTPDQLLPKLFGELRERYADRPGGYTRVLRTEPLNRHKLDQAESAILEFVDGKVDTRFVMTAAAVARAERNGRWLNPTTKLNVKKVTAFRKDGAAEFRAMVNAIRKEVHGSIPLETHNVDYHFERKQRRQAVVNAKAEAWAAKQAAKQAAAAAQAAMAADPDALDRFKDEDFAVKERGSSEDGAGEGRGARQRRRRREQQAATTEPEADEAFKEVETSPDWEDLEEAAATQAQAGRRAKKPVTPRKQESRKQARKLTKNIKKKLKVRKPQFPRVPRAQPRAQREEKASF